ncbi:hypothetical protein CSUB01_11427 [Colletotrichum sublineola]|uniref:Uncharacterized protein n=1 Tax=Colletotrichum sublineola TaxID=1173701 RepID=A0A066X479_COLSU|nr:hypothetical protein CSUB01_11427 [Colletotrichum sublineola]
MVGNGGGFARATDGNVTSCSSIYRIPFTGFRRQRVCPLTTLAFLPFLAPPSVPAPQRDPSPPPPPLVQEHVQGRNPAIATAASRHQPRVASVHVSPRAAAAGSAHSLTPPVSPLLTRTRLQVNYRQPAPRPHVLRVEARRGTAPTPRPAAFGLFPPGSQSPREAPQQQDSRHHRQHWRAVDYGLPSGPASRQGSREQYDGRHDYVWPASSPSQLRRAHHHLPQQAGGPPFIIGLVGGARTTTEALTNAMLRYNTAAQELAKPSINESDARSNISKALFLGPPRHLGTLRERTACTRALIASLVADSDHSEAASNLPMPTEGQFGPVRRLLKLHPRRHELVAEMRGLKASVQLVVKAAGVNAIPWHQHIMTAWEPEMSWLGFR